MAKRRKFLAGLGALASGSAAAVGTGAFTTASAERRMEVRVASDSNGYIGLFPTDSRYASTDGDQISLDFSELDGYNDDPGIGTFDGGKGLNPSSTFRFDDLFRIQPRTAGAEFRVVATTSGFNLENLDITTNQGESLLAKDYEDPSNVPKRSGPDDLTVNMTIETKDSADSDAGGTLTLHAATGADYEDDSFTELL